MVSNFLWKFLGGYRCLAPAEDWAQTIIRGLRAGLKSYPDTYFGLYFPELYLYPALMEAGEEYPADIGGQSVHYDDVSQGGNFVQQSLWPQ